MRISRKLANSLLFVAGASWQAGWTALFRGETVLGVAVMVIGMIVLFVALLTVSDRVTKS